jgi:hypothetical protein
LSEAKKIFENEMLSVYNENTKEYYVEEGIIYYVVEGYAKTNTPDTVKPGWDFRYEKHKKERGSCPCYAFHVRIDCEDSLREKIWYDYKECVTKKRKAVKGEYKHRAKIKIGG